VRNVLSQGIRRPWPYVFAGALVAAGLLILAGLAANDFTRIAVPGVLTGVGTLALASVTVWLSLRSERFQKDLAATDGSWISKPQTLLRTRGRDRWSCPVFAIASFRGIRRAS
jgi:hypothetical protein